MPSDALILRHVVLFGFTPDASEADIDEIVRRFASLRESVAEVAGFEWGPNTSPEHLSPELTHCFLLTFTSEAARDTYLIHPAHVAFAQWVGTWVEHVTVVDYWAETI